MIIQNPHDEYKNDKVLKLKKWKESCANNEFAIDNKNNKIPLKNFNINQLAFSGGFWRVQVDFSYKITRVRDKDMVLIKNLQRIENTLFEYWTAKNVGYNCYGPFSLQGDGFDYIVAKYETDDGVYWGYGETIEKARAFLGLKLYDEYKHLINSVACKKKLAQTR